MGAKGIVVLMNLNTIWERKSEKNNFLLRPGKLVFDRKKIIKIFERIALEI